MFLFEKENKGYKLKYPKTCKYAQPESSLLMLLGIVINYMIMDYISIGFLANFSSQTGLRPLSEPLFSIFFPPLCAVIDLCLVFSTLFKLF